MAAARRPTETATVVSQRRYESVGIGIRCRRFCGCGPQPPPLQTSRPSQPCDGAAFFRCGTGAASAAREGRSRFRAFGALLRERAGDALRLDLIAGRDFHGRLSLTA
jgi:hypothetical protein